jgi:hypothetical protein
MGVPILEPTADHSWGHGIQTLSTVLARGHEVRPWRDEPEVDPNRPRTVNVFDPTRVTVGGVVHLVPHTAAVRFRGDAAILYDEGRVRLLVAAGEVILDPAEEAALRSAWSTL